MTFLKAPLHIQILVLLAVGVVLGLLFNPGDISLTEDLEFPLEYREGKIVVEERSPAQSQAFVPVLELKPEEFASRFSGLADLAQQAEAGVPVTLQVQNRRLRLVEDNSFIHLGYLRTYNGHQVLTNVRLKSPEELAERFPLFVGYYETYQQSWSRLVTITSKWLGDLFLRMLKMITIPLIVTSIIVGVTGVGGTKGLGTMFSTTILYYVSTSAIAITIGLIMVQIIQPGVGAVLPGVGETPALGGNQSLGSVFSSLVDSMIPPNPVAALANGDFLSVITFSILFSVFVIRAREATRKTMTSFFEAMFEVMMGLTMFIIHLAPVGVLAFMTYAMASQGLEIFKTLAWYMLTVFLALCVHGLIVLPLLVKWLGRSSPWKLARATSPALMTAFSTASSNAALPLTISCMKENTKVSDRTITFVLPLGATINMDGTALYEVVAVLFIAQASVGFELTLMSQVVVAFTALLASIGAAGIPHAGLVMMAIVLQAVGLPLDAQGIIIAVDRLLDMCRTTVNIWSDICGCSVIERLTEKERLAAEQSLTTVSQS